MLTVRKHSYINFRMLARVIGWLLSIEALFMLIPCVAGLVYGEESLVEFLLCAGITAGCGMAMVSIPPGSREMGKREAILLTALTWVILSLFGMLPFLVCGTHGNVTDAFFETMSGFTTTGASVLPTHAGVPKSILLWRCVVQWIGGLGIILFTLAVVPMLNYQGGMQLFNAEVTGITHDKLRPRVGFTAKGLWMVYIALTTVLTILLAVSDLGIFDAICYGLSTMSTGGFATSDTSLVDLDDMYIKTVLTVFMFIGGVNFSLLYKATSGDWKSLLRNDALKWYAIITLVCYAALCANVWIRGLYSEAADFTIDPLFQAVSILSSTGLTEPDFSDWGPIAIVVLVFMMIMGACAGSTSGGAKVDRFIILVKFVKNEFYKMMHPSAVTTVSVNGKGTPPAIVMKTLSFLFLYIFVAVAGGIILILLGMPLKESFFLSLSSISNTGLGTDITGLSGNFASVPAAGKWMLSLVMLVGRLELYTVLLLFTPVFWRK